MISPDAFASNPTVIVQNAPGSASPGCEPNCFIPSTVRIPVGGTVTWDNTDTAAHTATSGSANDGASGVWDSSLIMAGGSYSVTLYNSGTYVYFCMVHPWMAGTVLVGTPPYTEASYSGEKTTSAYGTVETEKSQYELRNGQSIYVKIFGIVKNPGSNTSFTVTEYEQFYKKVHLELTKPGGDKLSVDITKTKTGYYQTVLPVSYENLGSHRVDVTYDGNHVGSVTFLIVDKIQAEKDRVEAAKAERERLERERLEQERLEQERLEQERLEQERFEQERLEQERLEQERLEQERIEQEYLDKLMSAPISSSIKEGMWIQYQGAVNLDVPSSPYVNPEAIELSLLQAIYGIGSPGGSITSMKYTINNVAGIKADIIDVRGNSCKIDVSLVMEDGSEESWHGIDSEYGQAVQMPNAFSKFCAGTKKNSSLKMGDSPFDPIFGGGATAPGPLPFAGAFKNMEVKEFSTMTISDKKVDVVIVTGKEISHNTSSKSEIEVEMIFHRHTGLVLSSSFSGTMLAGGERGDFSFSLFANDVSEHFVEKPILEDASKMTLGEVPLYIIIIAVGVGGGMMAVLIAKRGSKTPRPARQELDEYEEEYTAKQTSRRKPAKKKEAFAFCENCGNTLGPTAKFCGGCGTPRS